MQEFFKAVGMVIASLIVILLIIALMYLSYIVVIGVIIFGSIYIVYQILKAEKEEEAGYT